RTPAPPPRREACGNLESRPRRPCCSSARAFGVPDGHAVPAPEERAQELAQPFGVDLALLALELVARRPPQLANVRDLDLRPAAPLHGHDVERRDTGEEEELVLTHVLREEVEHGAALEDRSHEVLPGERQAHLLADLPDSRGARVLPGVDPTAHREPPRTLRL